MIADTLFSELSRISERPALFSCLTVPELWTDPHISEQMLRFHLDPSTDAASRRPEFIDAAGAWIARTFGLGPGKRVVDLGCGPGLYASEFARTGAAVTGVDFSGGSIAYARDAAERGGLAIDYVKADYLAWEPDERFDLVTLIFLDYCPLAPHQRHALLDRVRRLLAPGGAFLFDVSAVPALARRPDAASFSYCPEGGFWSAVAYFEFFNPFLYPDEAVALDKFTIVEAGRTRTFYNWFQHYTPETLAVELAASGYSVDAVLGDVAGRKFDPQAGEFAVIARPAA